MEKSLKSKRMSLDPAKNPFVSLQKHHNATELEVQQVSHDESQSTISNHHESYSSEELPRIFRAISKGSDCISCESLYSLLREEGYGDNLYAAVEMIALVDHSRKGSVSEEEFVAYFTRNFDEEKLPPLPPQMQSRKAWVEAIEENFELLKSYRDKEYCLYVAEKMKEDLANKRKETR